MEAMYARAGLALGGLAIVVSGCANGAGDSTAVLGATETTHVIRQVDIATSAPVDGTATDATIADEPVLPSTSLAVDGTDNDGVSDEEEPSRPSATVANEVELIPAASIVAAPATTVAPAATIPDPTIAELPATTIAPLPSTTVASERNPAEPTATSDVPVGVQLVVTDDGFISITVAAGTVVSFQNDASVNHSATSFTTDAENRFTTGLIGAGGQGSFVAPTTPGTYGFFSAEQPWVVGSLTVTG